MVFDPVLVRELELLSVIVLIATQSSGPLTNEQIDLAIGVHTDPY